MAATKKKKNFPLPEQIDASPVKSFFVKMLTRDIKLEEAILDLLDNCVDGILRNENVRGKTPYEGYWAKISFNEDSFSISDNCGGIPPQLIEYAFRMGRPDDRDENDNGTVGIYGIGMKRAIFKMGRDATIATQHSQGKFQVHLNDRWIDNQEEWQLPVEDLEKRLNEDGTTITVRKLNKDIKSKFENSDGFIADLSRMISTHYAFIIEKGFEVKINNHRIQPKATKLAFDSGSKSNRIEPFIWRTTTKEGVEVFLSVGFTRPIPTQDEINDDQDHSKYSGLEAGWTVICNDRAIIYADRTEMTGWGEANIPRFHNQFNAISGIVEFRSRDSSLLPTTTTKRGIDASSRLYLQVKNKMREGTRIFIDFTNRWKGQEEEAQAFVKSSPTLPLSEIKSRADSLQFKKTPNNVIKGEQYLPELPSPKKATSDEKRITFTKKTKQIDLVQKHLFEDDSSVTPSEVGEKCFDLIYKDAKK